MPAPDLDKAAETLDSILGQAAKVAGPAAPWIELGRSVAGLALKLAKAGHVPAEIRRRLADGIQRGDVVSDEALEVALGAAESVDDYLDGFDGGA